MALTDIKAAGILAGFTRWGWPWHGLCQGGAIGTSGKTISQPLDGDAWLIDKGLPALDMTPAEIASEAAQGREWRNYAMLSGGLVNGTWLPRVLKFGIYETTAFIHVDQDGINWLVNLEFGSFPSSNTCRLNLSIVRFGYFKAGLGPQSPVTKTVDVPCELIDLGSSVYRDVALHDVWTNGSKALFCVWLNTSLTADERDVYSAIELSISGSGGADGSGLAFSAVEVKGQSSLTVNQNIDGTYAPIQSGVMCGNAYYDVDSYLQIDCGVEVTWDQTLGFGGGYEAIVNNEFSRTSCRFCKYDMAGNVLAFRLKIREYQTHIPVSAIGAVIHGTHPTEYAEWFMTIQYIGIVGWYLLLNDTEVDKLVRVHTRLIDQQFLFGYGYSSRQTYTTQGADVFSWEGSLASTISNTLNWKYSGIYPDNDIFPGWKTGASVGSSYVMLDDDATKVGVHRTMNIAAFFLGDPTRTYGTIATPIGNKTSSETGALYFSWQRKTGDFAFSANPICYV